jgi:penicillin-binding protein 2
MLNATAAIANGGGLYRPQIVREIRDADGRVLTPFSPQLIRELPISDETIGLIKQGMLGAVSHGTAWGARLAGVAVAGKTGTAEYPGERDWEGNLPTHAWFTAFAPVDDPQIALVVFVEGGGEGSKVAVPIATEILSYYFNVPVLE